MTSGENRCFFHFSPRGPLPTRRPPGPADSTPAGPDASGRLDGSHPPGRAARSPCCRSGYRRHERPSPGSIPGREVKIGLAGIDEVLIAGRIVDVVEDLLEIDPGIWIGREQRDRDDGQAPAHAEGPEP